MIRNREHAARVMSHIASVRESEMTLREKLEVSAHAADKCGTLEGSPAVIAGRLLRRGVRQARIDAALVLRYLDEVDA